VDSVTDPAEETRASEPRAPGSPTPEGPLEASGPALGAQAATSPGEEDLVGDRFRMIDIGMVAVMATCVVFAVFRFAVQVRSGHATPWWANAAGAVAILLLYAFYRGDRRSRSSAAVHGIAAIATIALLVPCAYGMESSKWWLALVGFSVLLMGRRREGILWSSVTLVLVPTAAILGPRISVQNAAGELPSERAMAGFVFVAALLGITWAFIRVARARARALAETAASLQRANLVKSRFLAHMSHEVRTPLHGVIAMTDLALHGEASLDVRQQVESAQQSARLLLLLLNNILDVARGESDAIELDTRPFSVHDALTEVLRPLAAQARAKGLELSARAELDVVSTRRGDRVRFAQIVLNLVGNALKFTKRGRIDVRLRQAPGGDSSRLVLDVMDTGTGIPKEKLESIFEPFEQVSPSDATVEAGAGLGLAIVRDLARRMGGGVRVESELGKGSRFSVELLLPPADGAVETGDLELLPASEPLSQRGESPSGRSLHILLVEDNLVNQKVLVAMLGHLGHEATVAGDGLRAWELVQEHKFDMLLTDIEMPGIDGLELARRVRGREAATKATHMPILGATAHVGAEEQHRLLAAGIDAHLGKPFTLAELIAALARARRAAAQKSAPESARDS
jgi:two-component system CheB/CheR fusion protein